jgi:hypothetical protein
MKSKRRGVAFRRQVIPDGSVFNSSVCGRDPTPLDRRVKSIRSEISSLVLNADFSRDLCGLSSSRRGGDAPPAVENSSTELFDRQSTSGSGWLRAVAGFKLAKESLVHRLACQPCLTSPLVQRSLQWEQSESPAPAGWPRGGTGREVPTSTKAEPRPGRCAARRRHESSKCQPETLIPGRPGEPLSPKVRDRRVFVGTRPVRGSG